MRITRPDRHPPGWRILLPSVLALLLCSLGWGLPAHATTLIQAQELPALVAESRRAVLATVASVRHDYDQHGLHATFVNLEVEDRLYGRGVPAPGGTFTIKIYGSPEPMPDGSRLLVAGTPRYRVGDRLLLLLLDDSPWGFTNVTGLFSGAFRIEGDAPEGAMARSLGGNRETLGEQGLGAWLETGEITPAEAAFAGPTDGPVPYSLLRKAVLRLRAGAGASRPASPGDGGGEKR